MNYFIKLSIVACILVGVFVGVSAYAIEPTVIHFFERSDCGYCKSESAYLDGLVQSHGGSVTLVRHNIGESAEAKALYLRVAESVGLPKVTPITVIGASVIQGFDKDVTPQHIENAIALSPSDQLESGLADNKLKALVVSDKGCDSSGLEPCSAKPSFEVSIPFFGKRDVGALPLVALSFTLGFVDGFNPCAMWVLITFLILLSQVNDRKKMVVAAGCFLLAEAILYALILTVWYSVWDFVALDRIVTPLVGLISLVGGAIFLYRYNKTAKQAAFTCDVTSEEQSAGIVARLERIVSGPINFTMIVAIVGVALSVNIIEFACSLGIPQAYTKILEINNLAFFARQAQVAIYIIGYMIDDIVVFALAIWGFSYMQAHGARYARYSLLIGGIGLLVLGGLLIFAPQTLVWAK